MNICGIPIKQLNLVEDRADYYKHRQQGERAGREGLDMLAVGWSVTLPPGGPPPTASLPLPCCCSRAEHAGAGAADTSAAGSRCQHLCKRPTDCHAHPRACARPGQPGGAALPGEWGRPPAAGSTHAGVLLRRGAISSAFGDIRARLPGCPVHLLSNWCLDPCALAVQAYPMPQALPNSGFEARMPGFAMPPAPLPFANLPGFSQAASSLGGPAVTRPYLASQPAPPIFPPGSSTALPTALAHPAGTECRLSNGTDWSLPAGAASPYSTLDAQHASAASSPPMGELSQLATAINCRAAGAGGSSGSASPDLDAAAANRLAMWQLQNELLAGGSSAAPTGEWAAPSTLVTPTPSAEDEPPLRPCAPPLCACMQ
jgi:hypothetical protein